MFILLGLRGALSVSVVDAGLTEASLAKIGESQKNRIDSIGLARCDVGFLASADSKRVTEYSSESPKIWLE